MKCFECKKSKGKLYSISEFHLYSIVKLRPLDRFKVSMLLFNLCLIPYNKARKKKITKTAERTCSREFHKGFFSVVISELNMPNSPAKSSTPSARVKGSVSRDSIYKNSLTLENYYRIIMENVILDAEKVVENRILSYEKLPEVPRHPLCAMYFVHIQNIVEFRTSSCNAVTMDGLKILGLNRFQMFRY